MADPSNLFTRLEKEYGFPDGKLVKDGLYEILAEHSESRLKPYANVPEDHDGFNTFLAKNTESDHPFVMLSLSTSNLICVLDPENVYCCVSTD